MVIAELKSYTIKKIEMTNTIESGENRLLISDQYECGTEIKDDCQMAVTSFIKHVHSVDDPEKLDVWLEMEGIFALKGVDNSPESKRYTHMYCLNALYPYADQTVKFLLNNSTMHGISLRRKRNIIEGSLLDPEMERKIGEIIEFPDDRE